MSHPFRRARTPRSCLQREFSGTSQRPGGEWVPSPAVAGRLMSMRIDLNADLGEGVTDDDGLLGVVTSANLACGFHAGDEDTMRRVCDGAAERGVVVGAQVSYRDRENFGRKHMDVAAEVLTDWVAEQVEVLRGIAAGCRDRGRLPQAARCALQPGGRGRGAGGRRTRRERVAPGARAARARRSCGWRRRTGAPAYARGSRTVGTPMTGGWSRVTSPVRWSRGRTRSRPTPSRWRERARCARCACTVTRRGRSRLPQRSVRRSPRRGTTSGRGSQTCSRSRNWH